MLFLHYTIIKGSKTVNLLKTFFIKAVFSLYNMPFNYLGLICGRGCGSQVSILKR